jgi:hypothetical protein
MNVLTRLRRNNYSCVNHSSAERNHEIKLFISQKNTRTSSVFAMRNALHDDVLHSGNGLLFCYDYIIYVDMTVV